MKIIFALFLMGAYSYDPINEKTLDAEEFHLEWRHIGDKVEFKLTAPTAGWVALGFTEGTSIVNTNLIQGCVRNGNVIIEDQFVIGLGQHPPVEDLESSSRISNLGGTEESNSTTISFEIEKTKQDDYHYDLSEGKTINVWLAWSISDDFDHHSRKRIMRTIEL